MSNRYFSLGIKRLYFYYGIRFLLPKVTFSDGTGSTSGIITQHASHQFSTDIIKGEAVLKCFNLSFYGKDRYFDTGRAEIFTVAIDGNTIECDITLQLKELY
uniref:Uncharacterized protein n=1 Tax=Pseudobryopsis hainanensis TaxID=2320808 RepID=A0A386AXU9_9CHLO|nr:hypothetical protein [Pseudobryopsis hainanensis]